MDAALVKVTLGDASAHHDGAEALRSSGVLSAIEDRILDAIDLLPERYDEIPPRVLAVWLADLLVNGVKLVRDGQAGLGETEGIPVGMLGAAVGQTDPSNARRRLPAMKKIAEASRAADLSRHPVEVEAHGFKFWVYPS